MIEAYLGKSASAEWRSSSSTRSTPFYGRIQALRGVSINVEQGEIVAPIGSNGAGKTTTLRTISGLMHPQSGTIRFDNREITRTGPSKIVEMGVCQSPEGRRLFPRMTVVDNLFMGAYTRGDKAGITADMDRVFTLFPRLQERRTQIAGTLGQGGEQQMLAMGRSYSWPGRSFLDARRTVPRPRAHPGRAAIFSIVREINSQGTPVLLVEQNAYKALEVAHRGYVLETGNIVQTGTGKELLASEDVQRAYLGM